MGMGAGDHRLTVAPSLGPGGRLADVHEGVPQLVELVGDLRPAAVLDPFPIHRQLAAPLAMMVALPPEVEAGPQVEPGVGGHLEGRTSAPSRRPG